MMTLEEKKAYIAKKDTNGLLDLFEQQVRKMDRLFEIAKTPEDFNNITEQYNLVRAELYKRLA